MAHPQEGEIGAPDQGPLKNITVGFLDIVGNVLVQQKFDTFHQDHNGHAILVFPGIGRQDPERYVQGKSKTFRALEQEFPEEHIVVAHWPTVFVPETFNAMLAEYLLGREKEGQTPIRSVSCWGFSFGGAVALMFSEYCTKNNIPLKFEGISTLVSPFTVNDLKPWGKLQRSVALGVVRSVLHLSSKITGDSNMGEAKYRISQLPTKEYQRGDIDPGIPVQCFITEREWDPMVDSHKGYQTLRRLVDTVHPIHLRGEKIVGVRNRTRPFLNYSGSHTIAGDDMPRFQRELFAFLKAPSEYQYKG
jgi:hypothetical protein